MGTILLKGHVSYAERRKYKWVTEYSPSTCKKCAMLNGKEFDEENVPNRPHPNCRCKVEEISIINEIDSKLNAYEEEIEQLKLQAKELLGDSNFLQKQIEKLINESKNNITVTIEKKLTETQHYIKNMLNEIETFTRHTIDKSVIERIEKEIEKIATANQEYWEEYEGLSKKLKAEKFFIDTLVNSASFAAEDAAALWVLGSSKFQRGLDYVKKNGKIINKISDLNNKNLEETIRTKINQQINKNESRGVYLKANSSLSKSISNSLKFKSIILKNKEKLLKNETIPKISTFLSLNLNNYLSIHGCDIINVHIERGILRATIIDTIDYNKDELLVKIPRDLQDAGAMENYYVIIDIAEPVETFFSNHIVLRK